MPTPLRRAALLFAALAALLVAFLVFASTRTGFHVMLRPLLASRGVEVAEGRISLAGEIEASGIAWSGGSAERLRVSFDPLSLLPGRHPHVRVLEAEALSMDLTPGADEPEEELTEAAAFAIPHFEVEEAHVSVERLRQLDETGAVAWEVGPARLALEEWRPDSESGRLEVRAEFALPGLDPPRRGRVALDAGLGVPARPTDPLAFEGELELGLAPDDLKLVGRPRGSIGERTELAVPLRLLHGDATLLDETELGLALEPEATRLTLLVKRAPLPALLEALGREPGNEELARLELGLDAQLALAPDSGRIDVERLRLEQRAPDRETAVLALEGWVAATPAAELRLTGPGAEGGEGSAEIAFAEGELDLDVASLDTTPFVEPWIAGDETPDEAAQESAEPAAGEAGAPEDEAAAPLLARFEIGALRFRELLLREARGTLRLAGSEIAFELPAARLGEAPLSARFESGRAEGRRTLAWKLDAERLDLTGIFRSLDPTSDGQLSGKLDLASEASASVPEDGDPLEGLEGVVRFDLDDAQARGLPFQEFMASKLAVDGLASLAFTGAQGEIPIRQGRAVFEDLFVDGNAASFKVAGTLSTTDIDLSVNPRLGPRLASEMAPDFANALFETASGALALPVVFRVRGPLAQAEFDMRPAPPSLVGDVLGTTTDVLMGAGRLLLGGGGEDDEPADSD